MVCLKLCPAGSATPKGIPMVRSARTSRLIDSSHHSVSAALTLNLADLVTQRRVDWSGVTRAKGGDESMWRKLLCDIWPWCLDSCMQCNAKAFAPSAPRRIFKSAALDGVLLASAQFTFIL